MYKMQYLVPSGFPAAKGEWDRAAVDLGASLKGVDKKWVQVPNSALRLKLAVMLDGTSLEIKKRDTLVYINLFCVDGGKADQVMTTVHGLYKRYDLGTATRPSVATWIHSIPVAHQLLRDNELELCQKLTVSFFWAVYAQHLKKQNPFN